MYPTRQDVVELITDSRREFPGPGVSSRRGVDTSQDVEFARAAAEVENAVIGSGPLRGAATASALQHWIRTGVQQKAAIVEDSSGQVLLPPDLAVEVLAVARQQGMLRDLVTVRPTQLARVPFGLLSTATTAWGQLELGNTPPDAAVVPAASGGGTIVVQDLTSLVKVGVDELDDTSAATNQALAEVFGDAVAEATDAAIAAGSGSGQPAGLTLPGTITRIPSGQKITAASPPTIANMRALPWALPARWRPNATWLMSTDAAAAVALLTDAQGGPIWPNPGNPDPKTGGGLFGWPAYVVPGLPAMTGTNAPSILFGDLRSAYRLVDRQRITVQRLEQRYAETGVVGLLLRVRLGGDTVRAEALSAYLL
jgi:HK97 family phage major capsid protein